MLKKYDFKNCILIGENFQQTNTNYQKTPSIDKYLLLLKKNQIKNKIILIKGSRKMKLEKLLDVL